MKNCPLCGHEADLSGAQVVLDRNLFVIGNDALQLHPKEAELAFVLVANEGRPVPYDDIMFGMYGLGCDEKTVTNVKVQVSKLRRRLTGTPCEIIHVSGRGYCFVRKTK